MSGSVTKKAVVLLSGGLDSTTCLAIAQAEGYSCHAISFAYGQKHSAELAAAKRIAMHYDVPHRVCLLPSLQGSSLTDITSDVPDYHADATGIPTTYVPARNTIFLSIALGLAEVLDAHHIFIGVSSVDYSGYPDCRPEFIQAFEKTANLATKLGCEGQTLNIHAPLQYLTKAETIQKGIELGVDYAQTVSCYRADTQGRACGSCDSCQLRKQGFASAQVADPTLYGHDAALS